jgi:ubiquinone/menaquinone biosynthesis C-methylase UbiE
MLRLLSGYWFSQALYAVAALGVADCIAGGPRTADEIAAEAGADPEALHRLLRALSSLGIFDMGPRGFELTPLSETLLSHREDSLRPVALLGGHPLHWGAWGKLLDSIKCGKPSFELAHGEGFFDALAGDVDLMREFQRISTLTQRQWLELLTVLGLHRFDRVVDIGGGTGGLARRMAESQPNLRIVLFDRPEVLDRVARQERIEVVPGNFFEHVPETGDAYILKFVLHDWSDADASRILSCCRRHMPRQARLLIIEVLLPDDGTPSIAMTHDVNMLVLTGGRERSLEEYRALLRGQGFALVGVASTAFGLSVLEAVPDDNETG